MLSKVVSLLAVAGLASAAAVDKSNCKPPKPTHTTTVWESAYTATGTAAVAAARATAKTSSPTSHVKGKAFDRFVVIYFENEDYSKADGDREWNPPQDEERGETYRDETMLTRDSRQPTSPISPRRASS